MTPEELITRLVEILDPEEATTESIEIAAQEAVDGWNSEWERAEELDKELVVCRHKLKDIMQWHRGSSDPNACTAECGECSICSILDCPSGEPLHWHHDGCPVCDCPQTEQEPENDE